eukprot:3419057-Pyramimonas_sp.AAC.1
MFLEHKDDVIQQDRLRQKCSKNISWKPQRASLDASPLLEPEAGGEASGVLAAEPAPRPRGKG